MHRSSIAALAALGLTAPAGAQEGRPDPSRFVKAPGAIPVTADMEVGWAVRQEVESGGKTHVNAYAIVGEREDAWLVEHVSPGLSAMASSFPELKDAVLGLVVAKEDGEVLEAVLGRPGEPGEPVKIQEEVDHRFQKPEAERVEEVELEQGTFEAERFEQEEVTSWVGTSGRTEGVLLRVDGPGEERDFELSSSPREETVDVGGEIAVTRVEYTNGVTYWTTEDPIVAAFFPAGSERGYFRMEMGGSSMRVTERRTDAEPELDWSEGE